MHVDRSNLIETIPVPLALVSATGVARECNAAFRDLARATNVGLDLVALFGPEVRHLFESRGHGALEATLPLAGRQEPRRWFRITLTPHDDSVIWTVALTDVSDETAFRRRHRDCDREFQLLREIGASLSECADLESITERVYEQVFRLTRSTCFYVALHERERDLVTFPRYLQDGEWRDKTSRPFSNGLTEHVLRSGRTLLLAGDVFAQARALGLEPMGPECRSWLGVPMIVLGQALGVIAIQDTRRSGCYDAHDTALLEVIAGQAAAAVRNVTLLAESRRAYESLSDAQARLLESERARGITEAVGAMNHEINNPLAAIVGNAQLLLRRDDMVPPAVAKIESILEAARRIQDVTGKMSTLIQATSMPYPGDTAILDVRRSVAEGDVCELFPVRPRLNS